MKQFKLYLLALVGCLLFTACGGDDIEEMIGYTETYNIPAEGCKTIYTLKKLNAEIGVISVKPDWLTVIKRNYSSGSPSILITAEANTNKNERKWTLIIHSENGEQLTLTLVQAGANGGDNPTPSDIDFVYNGTSGRPACAKKK